MIEDFRELNLYQNRNQFDNESNISTIGVDPQKIIEDQAKEIEQKINEEPIDQNDIKTMNQNDMRIQNIFNNNIHLLLQEGEQKDQTRAINNFINDNNQNVSNGSEFIDTINEEEDEDELDEQVEIDSKQQKYQECNDEDFEQKILYDQSQNNVGDDHNVLGILQEYGDYEEDAIEKQNSQSLSSFHHKPINQDPLTSLAQKQQFNEEFGILNKNDEIYFQRTEINSDLKNEEQYLNNQQLVIQMLYNTYCIENNGTFQESTKETTNKDIMIGRENQIKQNSNQQLVNVNDILTYRQECSKIHCRIITKYYFGNEEHPQLRITNTFFSYYEKRFSHQSQNKQNRDNITTALVQPNVQNIIRQFLGEKNPLYLVDLNSKNGTQVKVNHNEYTRLQVGQSVQISSVNMIVEEISNTKYYNSFSSVMAEMIVEQLKINLASPVSYRINHGLPKEYQILFDKCLTKIQQQFSASKWSNKAILNVDKQWLQIQKAERLIQKELKNEQLQMIPYLKLKVPQFNKQVGLAMSYYFFYDKTQESRHFKIGRSSDNDVRIVEPGVSRQHCEITYDSYLNQWKIIDGLKLDLDCEYSQNRQPSFYRTWINLQNSCLSTYAETLYQLRLDDTIQIGDIQFQVGGQLL